MAFSSQKPGGKSHDCNNIALSCSIIKLDWRARACFRLKSNMLRIDKSGDAKTQ